MPSKFNPTPKDCLSYEQVAKELRYDPETGHLFWLVRKQRRDVTQPAGCLNHDGYRKVGVLDVKIQAHRLAWLLYYKQWPSMIIDHINGEKDDNRIVNLREVTRRQNQQNKNIVKKGRNLAGAYYRKSKNKYESRIIIDGQYKWLGIYDNEIDAHNAYLEAIKKYQTHHRLDDLEAQNNFDKIKYRVLKKSGLYFVNKHRFHRGCAVADFKEKENAEIFVEAMQKIQNMIDNEKFHGGL